MAKDGRFSRFHGDFVEQYFDAEFGKDGFDKVVLSHGYAAGHEQQIVLQPLTDFVSKVIKVVPPDAQDNRLGSSLTDLSTNRIGIAVSNLARLRLLIDLNQLISGRNNRSPRLL